MYRPDIDFLRALAVCSVVVFHIDSSFFPNGFIGVDIFFVISGYLISRLIYNDLIEGTFSFGVFYVKRFRRLFPAAFVVCVWSFCVAWLLLDPYQFKRFSESLVAIPFFLNNFLQIFSFNYFSPAAEFDPLVHFWSLAIEEQFYLFFPLFFVLSFFRLSASKFSLLWVSVFFISVLPLWFTNNFSQNFVYFSPFFRAWELLGGVVAFVVSRKLKFSSSLSFCLGFSGYLLLFYAFFIEYGSFFPAPSGIVLVLGVILVLIFGSVFSIVFYYPFVRFFPTVGLYSYSIYLVHQPVFAFARVYGFDLHGFTTVSALVFLVLVLAILLKHLVEDRFRILGFNNLFFIKFVFVGSFLLASFGLVGFFSNGFLFRFDLDGADLYGEPQASEYDCFDSLVCEFGPVNSSKNVLIFGDSFANQFIGGFVNSLGPDVRFRAIVSGSCFFGKSFDFANSSFDPDDCRAKNVLVHDLISKESFDLIVVSQAWQSYLDLQPGVSLFDLVHDSHIFGSSRSEVVLINEFGYSPLECKIRDYLPRFDRVCTARLPFSFLELGFLTEFPHLYLFEPRDFFTQSFGIDGLDASAFSDSSHLSSDTVFFLMTFFRSSFPALFVQL